MQTKTNTVKIRQNGMILDRFHGWRLHRTGVVSRIVGKVLCYSDMVFGNPRDPRSGKKVTPADFDGPVTVEVYDANGRRVLTYSLASRDQAAKHPNCTAVAW